VGSWNVLRTNSQARIAAGTRQLTTQADVFGLQELGSPSKRAAAARGAAGFTMTTDRTAVPILYRTAAYTALGQGRQQAFAAGQKVERSGGKGTEVTAAKYVTWVHLLDNVTFKDFYVLNTHLLVGAENSARQRKANPRRVALYERQLATLTAMIDGFRGAGAAVYATCDCNVDYRAKAAPVATMGAHGLTANWEILGSEATHGKRTLDYVWSNVAPASQAVGSRHGSDHAPVVVGYLPASLTVVTGSAKQKVASVRTVTDPLSGRTFQIPIPAGADGRAISFALDQVGDQWKFGSHGPDAWDCSGLTRAAWRAAGTRVVPQSDAQRTTLEHVSLAKAHPGDIFWRKGYVSIYLGTVGGQHLVVGSLKADGAVVIHTAKDSDIKKVLRPNA
jgi:cell wall-associated NlpC family hydrolase